MDVVELVEDVEDVVVVVEMVVEAEVELVTASFCELVIAIIATIRIDSATARKPIPIFAFILSLQMFKIHC